MTLPNPLNNPNSIELMEQQLRQQIQQAQLAEAQKVLTENTQPQ